jgi:hypothetical protein
MNAELLVSPLWTTFRRIAVACWQSVRESKDNLIKVLIRNFEKVSVICGFAALLAERLCLSDQCTNFVG